MIGEAALSTAPARVYMGSIIDVGERVPIHLWHEFQVRAKVRVHLLREHAEVGPVYT